jgi:hypothetical protein
MHTVRHRMSTLLWLQSLMKGAQFHRCSTVCVCCCNKWCAASITTCSRSGLHSCCARQSIKGHGVQRQWCSASGSVCAATEHSFAKTTNAVSELSTAPTWPDLTCWRALAKMSNSSGRRALATAKVANGCNNMIAAKSRIAWHDLAGSAVDNDTAARRVSDCATSGSSVTSAAATSA